jgi:hypothetical protein
MVGRHVVGEPSMRWLANPADEAPVVRLETAVD